MDPIEVIIASLNAFKHLKEGELDKFAFEAFNPETGFVKAGDEVITGLQNRRGYENTLFNTPWDEVDDTMSNYNQVESAF